MNHFIKLPDGAIINVAHVERVRASSLKNYGTKEKPRMMRYTSINGSQVEDLDGKIYEYFNSIAQEIK